MGTPIEWVVNTKKEKVYSVSHAQAVIRGDHTLEEDLAKIENNCLQLTGGEITGELTTNKTSSIATTQDTDIVIDESTTDNLVLSTASNITVNNGIEGKAWSKAVKIVDATSTITLGDKWNWINNEVPTLSANSMLILKWCYDYGIAGLISLEG